MIAEYDSISCQGIVCQTRIGFKSFEENILQPLSIDFVAEVRRMPADHGDKKEAIGLDYSVMIPEIKSMVESRVFNLIETVGEEVVKKLLTLDAVLAVEVSVTKHPLDLPDIGSVAYRCRRIRKS